MEARGYFVREASLSIRAQTKEMEGLLEVQQAKLSEVLEGGLRSWRRWSPRGRRLQRLMKRRLRRRLRRLRSSRAVRGLRCL